MLQINLFHIRGVITLNYRIVICMNFVPAKCPARFGCVTRLFVKIQIVRDMSPIETVTNIRKFGYLWHVIIQGFITPTHLAVDIV
jgi:hypothetical protein